MAVTNYYSVDGEIIGEKTAGSSRIDYLTDALGSVTATLNQSAQIVNTYRYKPYGGLLAKTGTGADPAFGWNGTHGYRPTTKKFSDFYVRARHDDSTTGRWTTVDPIHYLDSWNPFSYVLANPVCHIDPTGLLCLAKNVTPSLSPPTCSATKHEGRFLCFCSYDLKVTWSLEWTVDTSHGGNPNDCWVNQYQQDLDENAECYHPDDGEGWPYPNSCFPSYKGKPSKCLQTDTPGAHGNNAPCNANAQENVNFITCLCGTEGAVACFAWSINFEVNCCKVTFCKATLRGKIPPPAGACAKKGDKKQICNPRFKGKNILSM